MDFKTLLFTRKDKVGILKINRPQALNALNKQTLSELINFLESSVMKELTALIISGEGRSFVAGADIKEMQSLSSEEALQLSQRGQTTFQMVEDTKILTIAAVNGFALGGGLELALACDFIIASDKAKFGLPEVTLGLIPGYGGTQRLPRVVGRAIAHRMILTGEIISVEQASQWGLITKITSDEELLDSALQIASNASEKTSTCATYAAKKAINTSFDTNLLEGLNTEAKLFSNLFHTQDASEGIQAFLEKRPPKFKNK